MSGVLGDDFEGVGVAGVGADTVVAGAEGVFDVFVAAHLPGVGEHHGDAAMRVRGIGAEAGADGGEGEALPGVFGEDAEGGEHAEDAVEGGGVGSGGGGKGVDGGGIGEGHVIGDAELGESGEGAGDGAAPEEVHQLGGGREFGVRHNVVRLSIHEGLLLP